jgi:phosphoribosylglycinamide formyltransferase-1
VSHERTAARDRRPQLDGEWREAAVEADRERARCRMEGLRHGVELVVMAGFGTVLDKQIHDAYPSRILNTHPALLPAFPGWHAVEEALAYGVKVTGCTVHLATLEVDSGPILAQEAVPVLDGDTPETLHERIKEVEHRLYPETIKKFISS